MRTWFIALISGFLFSTVVMADPTGRYDITGKDPGGGGGYSGTAVVEKTGDTYRVTWTIDGERYVGTAIGDDNFIAISYRSKDQSGLALYGADGTGWKGVWTYSGGRQLGVEQWTRR